MPENDNLPEEPFKVFRRDPDDFEALYTNNIQFQPTEWDLRAILGEVDFEDGKAFIRQHTSVAMPWLQAKLLLYYLAIQVGVYEMTNGKIRVPASVFPVIPEEPSAEQLAAEPALRQIHEYVKKTRESFFGSQNA